MLQLFCNTKCWLTWFMNRMDKCCLETDGWILCCLDILHHSRMKDRHDIKQKIILLSEHKLIWRTTMTTFNKCFTGKSLGSSCKMLLFEISVFQFRMRKHMNPLEFDIDFHFPFTINQKAIFVSLSWYIQR